MKNCMSCGVQEVGPSRRQQAKTELKWSFIRTNAEILLQLQTTQRKEPNKANLKVSRPGIRKVEAEEHTAWYAG